LNHALVLDAKIKQRIIHAKVFEAQNLLLILEEEFKRLWNLSDNPGSGL